VSSFAGVRSLELSVEELDPGSLASGDGPIPGIELRYRRAERCKRQDAQMRVADGVLSDV
jgi:hypothetical protein